MDTIKAIKSEWMLSNMQMCSAGVPVLGSCIAVSMDKYIYIYIYIHIHIDLVFIHTVYMYLEYI